MKTEKTNQSILVISANPELAEIARLAVDARITVSYAGSEIEGRKIIAESCPDIVMLGRLEPPGDVFQFYRELREGWISRHSSLLLIELDTEKDSHRILGDENLVVGLGEYTFLAGETSPLLPAGFFLTRLKQVIEKKLKDRENKFKATMLDPDCFCLVWEQIPGPGAFEVRQEVVLENAHKAAQAGKFCSLSITDNPGGNPAIATDVLCAEIRKAGVEPLVHIAMRDKNRNQVESLLFQLAALDINNVLILSGDYPSNLGFKGKSKPVFDLDSVNGLRLAAEMNKGLEREIMRKATRLAPTDFFAGVAVSPFKQLESEVFGQFAKMEKKIKAGANFAITQVGYDARKFQELILWLKAKNYSIPVLGAIYVLSYPVAKAMHDNNVPGCVVTDNLLGQIAREAQGQDKGRKARLDRAAKMYAIIKGLGYKGAYISGQGMPYDSVEYIVTKGQELSSNWQDLVPEFNFSQRNGFYYFKSDRLTGLNSAQVAIRTEKARRPPVYLLSRALHILLFEPQSPLFGLVRKVMEMIQGKDWLEKPFHSLEYWMKTMLYGCKDCGDCALFDVSYLCPISQCPKDQRNGPCGGSYEGWCEVYPYEKQCIWVRAYSRLKSRRQEGSMGEILVPPCNWELWQSSSWANYFLGRDHVSQRTGIKPPHANHS